MMNGTALLNKIIVKIKKFFVLSLIVFLSFAQSVKAYNTEPKQFITELINDALQILQNSNLTEADKKNKIEIIALENVDILALGLYSLGDVRSSLAPAKLDEYQSIFKKYFIKSLNSRLADYSKQKIEVFGYEVLNENYSMVNSRLLSSDKSPEIKVDWRVYTKNKNNPLIRDLVIEGLSLARTQKEEFASILAANDNNIDILLEKLNTFINN